MANKKNKQRKQPQQEHEPSVANIGTIGDIEFTRVLDVKLPNGHPDKGYVIAQPKSDPMMYRLFIRSEVDAKTGNGRAYYEIRDWFGSPVGEANTLSGAAHMLSQAAHSMHMLLETEDRMYDEYMAKQEANLPKVEKNNGA